MRVRLSLNAGGRELVGTESINGLALEPGYVLRLSLRPSTIAKLVALRLDGCSIDVCVQVLDDLADDLAGELARRRIVGPVNEASRRDPTLLAGRAGDELPRGSL